MSLRPGQADANVHFCYKHTIAGRRLATESFSIHKVFVEYHQCFN